MSDDFDAPVTYDAAAEDYDRASERFWAFVSKRTVARLDLPRGANVLDVPCGPGWSAIAASEAVGSGGRILAVDLAPRMLVLAREKARRRNLGNIEFLAGRHDAACAAAGELRRCSLRAGAVLCGQYGGAGRNVMAPGQAGRTSCHLDARSTLLFPGLRLLENYRPERNWDGRKSWVPGRGRTDCLLFPN